MSKPYSQPGEKGTDTNQARECLEPIVNAAYRAGEQGDHPNNANLHKAVDQALKELEALIRAEKLKLLAEVRERVVGEGEFHVSHMCPQDNIGCAKFSQRCQTRNHQNAELAELEAEL